MNNRTDQELLREYAEHRSEAAFAELARRHVDLVYSAALRMVCDPHLAQDVAQGAFLALSQNAPRLAGKPVLSGWLHTTARNLAAKTVRAEVRRRAREQEAAAMTELFTPEEDATWEQVAPHLDAALGELGEADRDAVMLRFFERKSAREMAERLGIGDEAAQKRVSRALEKLRDVFAKRGIAVGASGLALLISTHAIQSAPAALIAAVSGTTLTGAAVSTANTVAAATKTIVMTALQKSLIAVIAVIGVATPIALHQRSVARQRAASEALQAQSLQLAQQQAENERLSTLGATSAEPANQANELQRLRADAAARQGATSNLPKLQAENQRLRAAANVPNVEPSDPEKQEVEARVAENKSWLMASYLYSRKNQGRFPASLSTIGQGPGVPAGGASADQYEVVYQGAVAQLNSPQTAIVLKQKQPTRYGNRWAKVYGYGDGHVETHIQAESDFTDWENQHITNVPNPKP